MHPERTPSLDLWAGVECTVNRVGELYGDQLTRSGHDRRLDDLDLFASLGIKTLRYPVLWERTERSQGWLDFGWADGRLGRLAQLGVRPIVGLLHHGSGPRHTGLLDSEFPAKFAAYAAAVARRYPWVEDYTPINEPLTTARFSALYGHWSPHARSDGAFCAALLHQVQATVLAMRAIRGVNPSARLIQTEDLGQTRSTPALAEQALFENHRRWLTFDLLCGKVNPAHPLHGYLCANGVAQKQLQALVAAPCPPDVVGVNHYVTSERFLDDRLERYPAAMHGGNGRARYVDVEAVRACEAGLLGTRALLGQAYRRYQLPLAVTEAHLACTSDEQLRWLAEVWNGAQAARDHDGVDVRAVTAWALLGAYDWDSLVTRFAGHYEAGVFDVRTGHPRATPLAVMCRELAAGHAPAHPALSTPGWWRREGRMLQPSSDAPSALFPKAAA